MSIAMMKANIDPYTYTWDEIINYLERLELSMALEKSASGRNGQTDDASSGKKRKSRNGEDAGTTDKKPNANKKGKSKLWCEYCKTSTHNTENCWFKNENKNKRRTIILVRLLRNLEKKPRLQWTRCRPYLVHYRVVALLL